MACHKITSKTPACALKHHVDDTSFARSWNVMVSISIEEQRLYIKIEYLRGKSGKEIYVKLVEIMHCLLRQSTGG